MLNTPGTDSGTIKDIEARLEQGLDSSARVWLHQALAEALESRQPSQPSQPSQSSKASQQQEPARPAQPAAWELHFASAGRNCGRGAALEARVLLLHAAGSGTETVTRLYHRGTAAERAAVLCALPHLDAGGTPDAVPLVEDALRANDTNLVSAAVGPYAAAHLDQHGWRHAVLKCLFTGVPTGAVADLARRAQGDPELARMLRDFAHERTAAGRSVPEDLHHVLELAMESAPIPAHQPEEF
ncbi:MAG TPA: EboA domain-containing protein [Streptomyces sp.]|jgi:hypothetical protein|nr:EboA domain-containing protein [Streptomyces sp.]